jgi:hypothetical protein
MRFRPAMHAARATKRFNFRLIRSDQRPPGDPPVARFSAAPAKDAF